MVESSPLSARSAIRAHHLPQEDRPTFRRWAKAMALVYLVIVAMLVVGFSLHDAHDARIASRSQTVGAERNR